ncbi:hypothetical protein APHAL10511_002648 [Amanita phalloides]|nr:hypothetical protein APHAL10511_002648 [Amanita phalloides]
MVCALLTWFRTWNLAAVMLIADNDVLILITIAGSIVMSTALIGTIGTMLNSRRILAVYAVLLWPALIAIFVVGRISYRRSTFALDLKLNFSWSRYYTPLGRLVIQNSLQCCGYYTPLHEATPSETCNANAILPGCKWSLYNFEKENLNLIWSVALSLVPLHTVNIIIALLCVNHITITSTLAGRQSNGYTDYVQALLHDVNHLRKPAISRASSGGKFREDRIA